jgi:DNA-nicking Smr family endonuclease|tara:strand:+ start:319 stop:558 length:240 start_codon:yes stop_codon:yes gene_type:complete
MENEIDLHGFNHDDAVIATEEFILKYSTTTNYSTCRIITGQSLKLQDKIISEVLTKHGFKYFIPSWNTGCIVTSVTESK